MRKKLLISAIFSSAVFFISSCGSGETATSSSESVQKTGNLTIGVKFPSSGGLSSQYIDQNTQCIEVHVYAHSYDWYKHLILTPENPQATITGIPVGNNFIYVTSYDGPAEGNYCTGNQLDYVNSYAYIVEGDNNFTINMLRAKWVFVDTEGNPISINLNGTLSTSNESIDGFYVLPSNTLYPTSIDTLKPSGENVYEVYFTGSNLSTCNSANPSICPSLGTYYSQLIGPDISNNAFETFFDVSGTQTYSILQPGSNGEPRLFFIQGTPPCYISSIGYYSPDYPLYGYYFDCSYTSSDNSIFNYTTSVTASDTMEGYIAEVMIKDYSFTYTCFTDLNDPQGSTITCPWDNMNSIAPSKLMKKAINQAIVKNQLLAQQTCLQDVTVNTTITTAESAGWYQVEDINDIDGDGLTTGDYVCDSNLDGVIDQRDDTNGNGDIECWPQEYGGDAITFYVTTNGDFTFDICLHPFTAKAQQIEQSELNLIIQRK